MPYAANGEISQAPIEGGIPISDEQYQEALAGVLKGWVVSIDGGFSVEPPAEEPAPEPEPDPTPEEALAMERARMIVSRFQGRAALMQADLLGQVEAIMEDPATDPLTIMAWHDASEFRRLSPTIGTIAGMLGLTDLQVDDLFRQAATIVA